VPRVIPNQHVSSVPAAAFGLFKNARRCGLGAMEIQCQGEALGEAQRKEMAKVQRGWGTDGQFIKDTDIYWEYHGKKTFFDGVSMEYEWNMY
jgi:hypothetical protein